jgi:hypothetical protein
VWWRPFDKYKILTLSYGIWLKWYKLVVRCGICQLMPVMTYCYLLNSLEMDSAIFETDCFD